MKELTLLVTRAKKGDLDAYGQIVRRFQDMAYGFGFSILGDFHLAQDAAQEAFIEAYRQLGQLEKPAAFPGWFRKIVFKHCDRIMRNKTVPTTSLDAAAGIAANNTQPIAAAEKYEMKEKILEAIKTLPEHQRTATTLFYINGYSQKEVAAFLDVPVPTVKKRLHDSRKKLKERMINMVEETLKDNAPDERFSQKVIDELLARPRPLEIEGHPVHEVWKLIQATLADYEVIAGDEVVDYADEIVIGAPDGAYQVNDKKTLRTSTTIAVIRAAAGRKLPVRLLTAGRVFRTPYKHFTEEDPTHLYAFHMADALYIDVAADIKMLKRILTDVVHTVLDPATIELTFQKEQFPSFENSLALIIKTKDTQLEAAACGMLTKSILQDNGFDPDNVQGFDFGIGLERLAMLKYGIDDIRKLWQPPYVSDKTIE